MMIMFKRAAVEPLPKFDDPPKQMDGPNKATPIHTALVAVHQMRSEGAEDFSTLPFLAVCNSVLIALDNIGPTMRVLAQDLRQNIERLETACRSDPSSSTCLTAIVRREVEEGNARKPLSCTRAILWLTRSMDFATTFLAKLVADSDRDLTNVVEESYATTLQPWHGWISSAAYKVALKLIPERKALVNVIIEERDDLMVKEEINNLVSSLTPILSEIHSFLATLRLDRLKSS